MFTFFLRIDFKYLVDICSICNIQHNCQLLEYRHMIVHQQDSMFPKESWNLQIVRKNSYRCRIFEFVEIHNIHFYYCHGRTQREIFIFWWNFFTDYPPVLTNSGQFSGEYVWGDGGCCLNETFLSFEVRKPEIFRTRTIIRCYFIAQKFYWFHHQIVNLWPCVVYFLLKLFKTYAIIIPHTFVIHQLNEVVT